MNKKYIADKIEGIRIDVSNMIQDLVDERNAWPERFDLSNKVKLKELRTICKRLDRLHTRLLKNKP